MIKQLTLIAVLSAPLVARADDAADPEMQGPPTKSPLREGATVTLSVGPAEIHQLPDASEAKETRIEGAGFSLRVGWNLSQSSAFEGIIDFIDDGSSTRNSVLGGSVKFYSGDALYFRLGGGLGIASTAGATDPMDPTSGGTERYFGAAAIASAGYEWFQLRDIALFGEFELMGIRLIDDPDPKTSLINASLLFGITWY